MLLTDARQAARVDANGGMVRLADQDRSLSDVGAIAEGHALVQACLPKNMPGPYHVQAAIAAVHTDAPAAEATDRSQIVALYDQLHAMQPNDIVGLNRAIAVAEHRGPEAGLRELDALHPDGYHLFHATRGKLLVRVGVIGATLASYDRAIELTTNETECRFLLARRSRCAVSS